MRRTSLALLIMVILSPAVRAQAPRAVEVATGTLNVRDAVQGTVLGQVSSGARFVVTAEKSGWLRIWYEGRAAWVHGGYVKRLTSGSIEEVTTAILNVRSGAGTAYQVIGRVQAGQRYVRMGTSGAWRRIQYGRGMGWVHGGYVRTMALGDDPPPAPNPPAGWQGVHAGLDQQGSRIPRSGLANETLRKSLGVAVEPYGRVVSRDGRSFVAGTSSWFGGPKDTGVTPTETGAVSGERLRSLNDPLDPDANTLARRPEDFYFVAMRWDYQPNGRAFWKDARILVVNPKTGRAVVVRPVDWGPHTRTGRVVDLSPQAMKDLGLETDDEALVAFARPGTRLGLVR